MQQKISWVSDIQDSKGNGDKKLLCKKKKMHTQQCHCATHTCGIRTKAPLWSVYGCQCWQVPQTENPFPEGICKLGTIIKWSGIKQNKGVEKVIKKTSSALQFALCTVSQMAPLWCLRSKASSPYALVGGWRCLLTYLCYFTPSHTTGWHILQNKNK